jgi:aromatic-L-amino-acid decarboxylase
VSAGSSGIDAGSGSGPLRNDEGPSLPLPHREEVLAYAEQLILSAWRSFDRARPDQPLPTERHLKLLSQPLPRLPSDPIARLDSAVDVLDVSLAQARPRYFAYIGSSGLEVGVLADALMASHDVNVAVSAGAADLLEAQTVRWVGEFVGFDPDAKGLMAAGGTISNLTALTAARERAIPGVRRHGTGAQRMALYCSAEAHYSVRRAAEVLGIGADNVRGIPLGSARRIDPAQCAEAIDRDRREGVVPVAVVATAGTTLTGTVDEIDALADVCRDRDLWLHVDGAYGLPAASTRTAGPLFKGLARADSATVDAHKWLYVPKSCSVLLVHDRAPLERAFSHYEDYIPHGEQLHAVDRTLEYSRPLSALKLWLAFSVHGADAIRHAIERNLEEAALLASLLRSDPRFEVLIDPPLSVVCFRRRYDKGNEDALNRALADALARDGRILVAPATADGHTWLRACMVNHRTTDEDVRAIPEVVGEVSDALLAET